MLAIQDISKAFGSKVIANGISFHFPENQRIALVGANGCGKSTLLKIIAGEEKPDNGSVVRSQGLKVGYLSQHANANPAATIIDECISGRADLTNLRNRIEELEKQISVSPDDAKVLSRLASAQDQFRTLGGYEVEAEAARILNGLGFEAARMKASPKDLSGGWRMRVELAKILLQKPDVLLLDEPTNHLDLPSLMWFERYLIAFVGTIIFVSHDRELLNRLSQTTVLLHLGQFESYPGNFDEFLEQRQARIEERQAQRQNLAAKRQELERFVERFGAKATKAAQAQSKKKSIEKLQAMESSLEDDPNQATIAIKFPEVEKTSKLVLSCKSLRVGYGSQPLPCRFTFEIERQQRIGIIGANGLGKSTLLKTIAGILPAVDGTMELGQAVKIGYYAQEQTANLNLQQSVLENMLRQTPMGERDARDLLGSLLFRGDDVFKPASVLSGGERSRLALALVLGKRCNFLLLDEPTNHLDLSSAATLADALSNFSGTLMFVSHDRGFLNEVATHCLALAPGGATLLSAGGITDFPRAAASAGFPNILEPISGPTTTAAESTAQTETPAVGQEEFKRLKSQRQKLTTEVANIEQSMTKQRQELERLEVELGLVDFTDYVKTQDLTLKVETARSTLNQSEERWITASEQLEQIITTLTAMGRN